MNLKKCSLLAPLFLLCFASACGKAPNIQGTPSGPAVSLSPYIFPTKEVGTGDVVDLTPVPTTTPQLETYTVMAGDSFLAIAYRYGIDVTDLMNANPGVDPNSMSIGTKLVIPVGTNEEGSHLSVPGLPTPVIGPAGEPDCYLVSASEWMCFLLVRNDQAAWVENISGTIAIPGDSTQYPAHSPLNALAPGDSIPLVAIIEQRNFNPKRLLGSLDSALPVFTPEGRYGAVEIRNQQIEYSGDRQSASVLLSVRASSGGLLRLVAYGMDTQGDVLGYRIWESQDNIEGGQTINLNLFLNSLGGGMSEIHFAACTTSR